MGGGKKAVRGSWRPGGADYELIDLAHHRLGNLDEGGNPSLQQYEHAHTRDWSALVDGFDGFVFLVPEYNHSFPGEGLDAAVRGMLDQVTAWDGALRGVREARSETGAAA
ncbi:NAD(P)H-dependent oxidoreductase [Nonomuraea sp. NPDC049158]|uniref:NADPH-dependent FMN reductase n=1 Tax=Nonomuraea sp. NPDC049158 TaxID=3155649 RepID=UPI0033F1DA4E